MTFEQAKAKLDADHIAIERALSDLDTAKAFIAVGETETGINLFAQIRHTLALQLMSNKPICSQSGQTR